MQKTRLSCPNRRGRRARLSGAWRRALVAAAALSVAALFGGCDGHVGNPLAGDSGGGPDSGRLADGAIAVDGPQTCPAAQQCGGMCCAGGQTCAYNTCVTSASCSSNNDCENDSYCDSSMGVCIPYGSGPGGSTDPSCTNVVVVGVFAPATQCDWSGPPSGDAFPNHANVLATPMVADFNFDNDPKTIHPSIVFQSYDGTDGGNASCVGSSTSFGVIRVINGQDCSQQYTLPAPHTVASTPVAIGDLDGDGRPDIVAQRVGGGLVAYKYDPSQDKFVVLWQSKSTLGAGVCLWSGPSIHDLNNDGKPEVIMGATVFNGQNGDVIDGSLGLKKVSNGQIPVVGDVDGNGHPDLMTGDAVYEWNPTGGTGAGAWKALGTGLGAPGLVALGDFGTFGADPSKDDRSTLDGIPEVVVISNGQARIQTIAGRVIFGPITLKFFSPATDPGSGGPPTVGDFDGDGRAEFAVAGRGGYNVFDPDCQGSAPDKTTCPTGSTNGILWAMPTQDYSSSVTGSSVFDFEGDGRAEAVYADECFSRVYDGQTGNILYSQFRTSCTWYENPVVADVDGDFNSEIVIPSNNNCNISCPALDPNFNGPHCLQDSDCPGTTTCVKEKSSDPFGLCRCQTTSDCGGNGFVCADPIAGPSPKGKVCRAGHPSDSEQGVRVIRDALDRWVNSRPIWNQHAYSVTNVNDDGTIPATSAWKPNWATQGLNNFRQNIAENNVDSAPDATSRGTAFDCTNGTLTLTAKVCNRGTQALAQGLPVTFYQGSPPGAAICTTTTAGVLDPGSCAKVSCDWQSPPSSPTDVTVVADDDGTGKGIATECHEGNNSSVIPGVSCGVIQ